MNILLTEAVSVLKSSSETPPVFNTSVSCPQPPQPLYQLGPQCTRLPELGAFQVGPLGQAPRLPSPSGHGSLASSSLSPRECYCFYFWIFSFLSFFFFYGDYFTSRDFAFLQQQTWSPPGSVFTSAFRRVYEAVARTIPGGGRWGQKELEKLLVDLRLLFLERWALSESRTPGDLSGKRTPREAWVHSSPRSCPGCLLLPPLLSLPVCRAAVFAAPA